MDNTSKPVFNADAAEEYFSDLLTFYRNTANDIFRRDNEGRDASNQTYSAEYQKWLGMQIAMREVLEYFSKYDLCERTNGIPDDRLRELVEADRAGRVKILSSTTGMTCGACDHFKRIPGTCRGRCSERPYCRNKYGHTDERRGEFTPSQSRIACKMFDRRKGPEMPDISGMSEEAQKLFRGIPSVDVLKGEQNG